LPSPSEEEEQEEEKEEAETRIVIRWVADVHKAVVAR
jgi:hypothetical protein